MESFSNVFGCDGVSCVKVKPGSVDNIITEAIKPSQCLSGTEKVLIDNPLPKAEIHDVPDTLFRQMFVTKQSNFQMKPVRVHTSG